MTDNPYTRADAIHMLDRMQQEERNQHAIDLVDRIEAFHSSNDWALQDAVLAEIFRRILTDAIDAYPEGSVGLGAPSEENRPVLDMDGSWVLSDDEYLIIRAVLGLDA